jgi:hypothetical protein
MRSGLGMGMCCRCASIGGAVPALQRTGHRGRRTERRLGRPSGDRAAASGLSSDVCPLFSAKHARSACLGLGAGAAREGHLVDALAPRGDEGRGTLRKAEGRGERPLILGSPNGATHRFVRYRVVNP